MVQKTPPGTLIKHKKFFCENTIFVKKFFAKKRQLEFVSILQNLLTLMKNHSNRQKVDVLRIPNW